MKAKSPSHKSVDDQSILRARCITPLVLATGGNQTPIDGLNPIDGINS